MSESDLDYLKDELSEIDGADEELSAPSSIMSDEELAAMLKEPSPPISGEEAKLRKEFKDRNIIITRSNSVYYVEGYA